MDLTDNVIKEVQQKEGLIASFLDTLPEKALNLGFRIGLALIFFFIGVQLIKLIRKIIRKSMNRAGAEMGAIQFVDSFVKACHVNEENGAHRFSIVTAGRTLVGKEFDQIVSDAHKKAGQIIDTSKKEAALQKEKVMNKAEQEIRGMILEAAVKSMQSEHNDEALYDEFLTKAGESTHEES